MGLVNLELTKVQDTLKFLSIVKHASNDCPTMTYKYDWDYRFEVENIKYAEFEGYTILSSDSSLWKNYPVADDLKIIIYKKVGSTDK